ncbi:hypothetical protein [Gallaecimonas mangrovi]|uniref:hypothetical protein n=1 Tax=Gallaecimonas mangrovi TaxID=2291597 RepID=UPI000E1FCD1B|nr:hypothetical protein [Gallaecimonas mangrovi]
MTTGDVTPDTDLGVTVSLLEKIAVIQQIKVPVQYRFASQDWLLEVQYFVCPATLLEAGGKSYWQFAVTSDGWALLVEAADSGGAILQKEGDDIDYLDVSLDDLGSASHLSLA